MNNYIPNDVCKHIMEFMKRPDFTIIGLQNRLIEIREIFEVDRLRKVCVQKYIVVIDKNIASLPLEKPEEVFEVINKELSKETK